MDILQLRNISSGVIKNAAQTAPVSVDKTTGNGAFESIFAVAVDNIKTTNGYLSDAENEEIKWALGESENTHDLAIALQKASTSLQYTVAIRDKVLEAYKEIMAMQI